MSAEEELSLHALIVRGQVELDARALRLAVVHRNVRPLQKGRNVVSVLGSQCDSRRGGDGEHDPIDVHRLGDRSEKVTHYSCGLFRPDDVGHDEGELIAAEPGDRGPAATGAHQGLGDLAEEPVAGAMAKGVIDLLEPVEVQQRDSCPARLGERGRGAVKKQGPVGEPSQQVMGRLVPLALGF